MLRTVHRVCTLCEASCGLTITVEGDRITKIAGDAQDPLSRGSVCPKGIANGDLHHDPDQLRTPLRRTESGWEPMAWDDALDYVAERLHAIKSAHGNDAIGIYRGNPSSHNLGLMLFGPDLYGTLGTRNLFSAVSMDILPHLLVNRWMYGHRLLFPVADIERTSFLLILGGNPAVSNSSMMTAPGFVKRAKALRARGGRLVVVDPRRTETATLADQHVFIRPGTDALLLAAMVHVLLDEKLAQPGALTQWVDGLDVVTDAVRPFSPQRVAEATKVPAETIVALARELAAADGGIVYGRMGTSVQAHGATCQWLIAVLNIITGNLDRPGGLLFASPALDPIGMGLGDPGTHGRWTSRVRGLPEFSGELPVATMADEMLTEGPGQIRGFVCISGNPVLSTPSSPRLQGALRDLEFMVSIDPYLNETSRHADVILPPVSVLERDHYDLLTNLLSVRNVAKWSPRVFDPGPERLDDWQIVVGLTLRLARGWRGLAQRIATRLKAWLGPRRLIALALRKSRSGVTLKRLEASPHGIDLGPLTPSLPKRLQTANKRINAAPAPLVEGLGRVEALLTTTPSRELDLLLIGRRELRSNNSWMHNIPRLMKGKDRCTLLMHPDDAAARGLSKAITVRVVSGTAELEARLKVSDSVMAGVVSLPHGYGHDGQGTRLSTANHRPGVNANALTDAQRVDPIGGTAVLNGVPVRVTAAPSPRQP